MENDAGPRDGLLRGRAAYAIRTPWTAGLGVAATILILAAGIFGAVAVVGSTNLADPGLSPGRRQTETPDRVLLATLGAWQGITILLTVAASALFGGRIVDVLALRRPAGGPSIYLKALVAMLILQILVSIVQYNTVSQDMFTDLRPFVRLAGGTDWPLTFLVVGIGAPLAEELLFRGFLLSALARSVLGFAGAAVVSSAAWTALHAGYSAAGIAEVFLIGLFFSWLLWRTGSLRVCIFCHALYNSLIVVALRLIELPA